MWKSVLPEAIRIAKISEGVRGSKHGAALVHGRRVTYGRNNDNRTIFRAPDHQRVYVPCMHAELDCMVRAGKRCLKGGLHNCSARKC